MNLNLRPGALVKVRAYGGKEIFRRFVGELNGTILICSDEEYRLARLQKRNPLCVGFPVADVIGSQSSNRLGEKSNLNRRLSLKSPPKKPIASRFIKKRGSKEHGRRRNSGSAR